LAGVYDQAVDRESAYEMLRAQAGQALQQKADAAPPPRSTRSRAAPASATENLLGSVGRSVLRTFGTQIGRQLARGLLGSLTGKR